MLLDAVCEYHDEARLEDHVVAHVHVLARHHRHGLGLPPGDAPAHVLLVLPPMHLPRLQRQQSYIDPKSGFVTALRNLVPKFAQKFTGCSISSRTLFGLTLILAVPLSAQFCSGRWDSSRNG